MGFLVGCSGANYKKRGKGKRGEGEKKGRKRRGKEKRKGKKRGE